MIPEKNRSEWERLVKGEIKNAFSSLVLQIAHGRIILMYQYGQIEVSDGVDELHELCLKHNDLIQDDIEKIFQIKEV